MAKDLEKALRAMDDSAPAPATPGVEQNALIPADLRVHQRPLVYYWIIVFSVMALTNHLFVGGSAPMLTMIFVFVTFLAAICLVFRAVIKQAA